MDAAAAVADAYAKNGIRILEITLTTPDAFDLIVAKLGPKPRRISVNEFSRIKKQALREVLQEQRKAGLVEDVDHPGVAAGADRGDAGPFAIIVR